MKGLTAKSRIALGQVGLLVSVLLAAVFLGLVPDRSTAIKEGRAALAEAVAANSSILVSQADTRRLEAMLRFVAERNSDLLSAAVRQSDGTTIVTIGDHEEDWIEIYNNSGQAVDLEGWSLSDDPAEWNQWTFPSHVLEAGHYLVIFASGKDRKTPTDTNWFHTNFKLYEKGNLRFLNHAESACVLFCPYLGRMGLKPFTIL